jgi:hypothetical protein
MPLNDKPQQQSETPKGKKRKAKTNSQAQTTSPISGEALGGTHLQDGMLEGTKAFLQEVEVANQTYVYLMNCRRDGIVPNNSFKDILMEAASIDQKYIQERQGNFMSRDSDGNLVIDVPSVTINELQTSMDKLIQGHSSQYLLEGGE